MPAWGGPARRHARNRERVGRPLERLAGALALVALCLLVPAGGASCGSPVNTPQGKHAERADRPSGLSAGRAVVGHLAEPEASLAGRWTLLRVLGSRRFRHASTVVCVAFVGDGSRFLSGSCDGAVKLWDARTGAELRSFPGHQGTVISLSVSLDGTQALSTGEDGTIRLWDLSAGRQLRLLRDDGGAVWAGVLTPDGEHCLSGGDDGLVKLWDLTTGAVLRTFAGHTGRVSSLALDAPGRLCVSGGLDKTVRVFEVATGREQAVLRGHQAPVTGVALSPDGRLCASASPDGTVRLWKVETGEPVHLFHGNAGFLAVAFSPTGRQCLTGDTAGEATLWDTETGSAIRTFHGHRDAVWSVAFSRDGSRCLSGGADCQVRLWDPASATELLPLAGHQHEVTAVALSSDGKECLSASRDGTLKLWDVATGKDTLTLPVSGRFARLVGFLPDGSTGRPPASRAPGGRDTVGRRCIYACDDGSLHLWDLARNEEIDLQAAGSESVSAVAIQPDGKQVLTRSATGALTLWQLDAHKAGTTFGGGPGTREAGAVSAVALSSDKALGAAGTSDGAIELWDLQTRAIAAVFPVQPGDGGSILALTFTPGDDRLFAVKETGGLLVCDISQEGGSLGQVRRASAGRLTRASFRSDGRCLACLTGDGEVQLYDTGSGDLLASIPGDGGPTSLAFSGDGCLLAVGNRDSTVTLYSRPPAPPNPSGPPRQ